MAKLTNPLMSMDASGSVGGSLTFSKWKGRNYVRQLVRPTNPNTAKQISVRAMMKFLSQAWAGLGPVAQSSWSTPAAMDVVSEFNAYTKANLNRWRSYLAPGQANPIGNTGTDAVVTGETATGGARQALLQFTVTTPNQAWGMAIFRNLGSVVTPSFANLVQIVPIAGANPHQWTDSPLDPGTYHYKMESFSQDGKWGATGTDLTATVT